MLLIFHKHDAGTEICYGALLILFSLSFGLVNSCIFCLYACGVVFSDV